MKGVYVLIFRVCKDTGIQIGRLGKFQFNKGFYAYTGSARGAGGWKRVTRHFNVASGRNKTRKWHIDFLLPHSKIICAVLLPSDNNIECTVAKSLEKFAGIPGFGCSDCRCDTHLFYADEDFKNAIIDTCNKILKNESIIIIPCI